MTTNPSEVEQRAGRRQAPVAPPPAHSPPASRTGPCRSQDVMNERIDVPPSPVGDIAPEAAECVGILRRTAADRLENLGLDSLLDTAAIIVSELVTNALLHTSTSQILFRIRLVDDFLGISVDDSMTVHAEKTAAGPTAESGRGLELVAGLLAEYGGQWGTSDAGSVTWCVIRIPEAE
ncbi:MULTISPECIES: ATP-binding protein [unclassified Streptomyces]|uniref:ATP-binding protein n=1 Tax=unclassified Streptomyces TaxID=2593676 RepID=UPI000DC57E0D|nr:MULTISPECIES: ATP-binding protein [unclassified Streptomyces]MYT71547.1 ATP-binding protein [Streptomyces sp. SID8367]RAJ83010.1 hypothetical protein K377_04065 [Streptomyces sp. PsTaAH-137]